MAQNDISSKYAGPSGNRSLKASCTLRAGGLPTRRRVPLCTTWLWPACQDNLDRHVVQAGSLRPIGNRPLKVSCTLHAGGLPTRRRVPLCTTWLGPQRFTAMIAPGGSLGAAISSGDGDIAIRRRWRNRHVELAK